MKTLKQATGGETVKVARALSSAELWIWGLQRA